MQKKCETVYKKTPRNSVQKKGETVCNAPRTVLSPPFAAGEAPATVTGGFASKILFQTPRTLGPAFQSLASEHRLIPRRIPKLGRPSQQDHRSIGGKKRPLQVKRDEFLLLGFGCFLTCIFLETLIDTVQAKVLFVAYKGRRGMRAHPPCPHPA